MGAPMIDNPEFKGEWKAPMIDNADYKPETYAKYPTLTTVGFELWIVNKGSIFDNILVTDDVEYTSRWRRRRSRRSPRARRTRRTRTRRRRSPRTIRTTRTRTRTRTTSSKSDRV